MKLMLDKLFKKIEVRYRYQILVCPEDCRDQKSVFPESAGQRDPRPAQLKKSYLRPVQLTIFDATEENQLK